MNTALLALITIVMGVGGGLAYFFVANKVLDTVEGRPTGAHAARTISRANKIRPWLFVAPAVLAICMYLVYPVCATLWYSLSDPAQGGAFVGLDHYTAMFDEPKFWEALRNNLLWLCVVPAASTMLGLLAAQLTDCVSWGKLAKSLLFMPMAISFVGAAVIFKLIYDTRPVDQAQIGLLNAVWLQFNGGIGSVLMLRVIPAVLVFCCAAGSASAGFKLLRSQTGHLPMIGAVLLCLAALCCAATYEVLTARFAYGVPQVWLAIPRWNSVFLMLIFIWGQTGFAMVILSAALRNIPEATVEAAILDGASPLQIFLRIKIPLIAGTLLVVWTLITVMVLKVFDIVFAMTNGQWETQVLANYMFDKLSRANDWGMGSAAAMVIMALLIPILIWNVHVARKDML